MSIENLDMIPEGDREDLLLREIADLEQQLRVREERSGGITPLTWTTTKPTQSGFYWYCEKGHDFPKDADVVEVDFDSRDMDDVWQTGNDSHSYASGMNGYWAGPISKPEMPT